MKLRNENGLDEDRVREIIEEELDQALEYYVEADEVGDIVNDAVKKRKNDFEDSWQAKHDMQERIMQDIHKRIDDIVSGILKDIVAQQVKMIEDRLLVELARKAMSLGGEE